LCAKLTCILMRVSVKTTSAQQPNQRPVFVDCNSRRLGIDCQCTHSLHRNDMAYCHFGLCRDCGLGCFSESSLADIRRLSVVAVVFLYQMTVFFTTKHNSITFGTLFQWLNANCVHARRQSTKRGRRWGRCSIYTLQTPILMMKHIRHINIAPSKTDSSWEAELCELGLGIALHSYWQ